MRLFLNDVGVLSAAGKNKVETLLRLHAGDRSGLVKTDAYSLRNSVYVGTVQAELPKIDPRYWMYDCRNNQLLVAALSQIRSSIDAMIRRYGANRIGIVIGTSTAGIRNTETALMDVANGKPKPPLYHYKQLQFSSGADFLAHLLGISGPAYAVSTACSSSGLAFVSARRLIELNLCDMVIVGGADSLSRFTVSGFAALESVSQGLCKPFGRNRDGINLAEAAALFILSREEGPVVLKGIGATTDAHHLSAPDPSGNSVVKAMKIALMRAQKEPQEVDYLNLHGTATMLNDAMESKAVHQVFGESVAVSSSKGMTGHPLGSAAAVELAFCWLSLTQSDKGRLIPNVNGDELDEELPRLNFVPIGGTIGRRIDCCQSNSFAFGGNNVSIIISRT